jgi:hypothetical protein
MKRKRTAAEKRAARERKKKFMTIFINGKQKRVPRPPTIGGLPVEEFIARNADPIWLHENGLWEFMTPDGETCVLTAVTRQPGRGPPTPPAGIPAHQGMTQGTT